MEHERTSTPEKDIELPTNVFDLDKLTAEQVATLVAVLGPVQDVPPREGQFGHMAPEHELLSILMGDMKTLAERTPNKANELFMTLTATNDIWTKSVALDELAEPLLKQYATEPEKRQTIIDEWLKLLEDDDENVREAALDTLSNTVYAAHVAGWLDEPTLQYLDSKLPLGRQRSDP